MCERPRPTSKFASVLTHSFASCGEIGQDLFGPVALESDGPRGRGPDEGFRIGIAMIDPFDDGCLEFGNAVEYASAYLLASDLCEKTLNEIEPGRRCRDEVQFEARVTLEPPLHSRCLVCGVVVDDQVQIEIGKGFPVDLLEEFEEILGTMARHAFADDLTGRHI